jgi:cobalt-zinc-cadmium efflux system outer membrane protein
MKQFIFGLMILFCEASSIAQSKPVDSVSVFTLDFQRARDILLKSNLSMLASYYDVEIADAELIQARLWNNPYFILNQELYSVEQNKYFSFRNQKLIQIEQVFSIAGKYTNTVKLSRMGVELAKLQLQDVLRSLVFDLGEHYYALEAAQLKQQLYDSTLVRYDQLIRSAEERLRVGAMASNEVLRLKSEQIAVKFQATENRNEVLGEMSSLRILLNLKENVYVQTLNDTPPEGSTDALYILIDQALNTRPDYKLSSQQVSYQTQNLRLQKSIGVPDLKLAYQPTDRGSNYVRPYQGANLEFNIPLFNRNQGNIKMAKSQIAQAELRLQLSENTVRNDVARSYEQFLNTKKGYEEFSPEFVRQTEELNTHANENYRKKNINLLEFIDLQRIYIINKTQYIDLKNAYFRATNQLNFVIGRDVINK